VSLTLVKSELDLGVRGAQFHYQPEPNAGISSQSVSWAFFNPKADVTCPGNDALVTPAWWMFNATLAWCSGNAEIRAQVNDRLRPTPTPAATPMVPCVTSSRLRRATCC